MKNLYNLGDIFYWLVKVLEASSKTSCASSHYQSFCEDKRVFIAQRGKNKFGNFIKLSEISKGVSVIQLLILEGQNGDSWMGFTHFAKEMVGLSALVSVLRNRAIPHNRFSLVVSEAS